MKSLNYFHVHAFTLNQFSGNPAAVVLLEQWPTDIVLQAIAKENNLPVTVFLRPQALDIRWFTPNREVDLCGHGTLAAGYVLSNQNLVSDQGRIELRSNSGPLALTFNKGFIQLDFPRLEAELVLDHKPYQEVLGFNPESIYLGQDLILF